MMLVDGQATSTVSARDRGLHYGDGLFETIAMTDGRPRLWTRHMQRLISGCQRLGIPAPDPATLMGDIAALASGAEFAVAKIIITRGDSERGYAPPADPTPRRIVMLTETTPRDAGPGREGVLVQRCTTRLGSNPALGGIKHLNRLEQVIARAELQGSDAREGLMLDEQGHLVEGTMSNLFLVLGATLITPTIHRCGVAGVVREAVLELAGDLGLAVEVREVALDELSRATEAFLTNSLIQVWPIRAVRGHHDFGPPGTVTTRIAEAVSRLE